PDPPPSDPQQSSGEARTRAAQPHSAANAAGVILAAFDAYRREFKRITRMAGRRFDARDWHGAQSDSVQRLEIYTHFIDTAVEGLNGDWAAGAGRAASDARAAVPAGKAGRAGTAGLARTTGTASGVGTPKAAPAREAWKSVKAEYSRLIGRREDPELA